MKKIYLISKYFSLILLFIIHAVISFLVFIFLKIANIFCGTERYCVLHQKHQKYADMLENCVCMCVCELSQLNEKSN